MHNALAHIIRLHITQVNEILYSNQEVGDRLWQGAVRCMCRVDATDEVWMGTTAGQLYVFRVRDVWEDKGTHSHWCSTTQ